MALIFNSTSQQRALPHLHQPERGENETFAEYKARRAASKAAARKTTGAHLSGGVSSRAQFRDSMRKSGTMGKRVRASDALMAAWAAKRVPKWEGPRDEHGAYTVVGSTYTVQGPDIEPTSREHVFSAAAGGNFDPEYTARRKWLAGISAQRGY